MKKISRLKQKNSFHFRIALLCIVLSFSFVIAITAYGRYTTNYMQEVELVNSKLVVSEIANSVESQFEKLETEVFSKNDFNYLLNPSLEDENTSSSNEIINRFRINNMLEQFLYLSPVVNWIIAVDKEGNSYKASRNNDLIDYDEKENRLRDLQDAELFKKGTIVWRKGKNGTINFVKAIFDYNSTKETGYLIINFDTSSLSQYFNQYIKTDFGDFCLLNNYGEPFYYSFDENQNSLINYSDYKSTRLLSESIIELNSNKYLVTGLNLANDNIVLLNFVNLTKKQRPIFRMVVIFSSIAFIVIIIVIFFTWLFLRSTSSNIKKIVGSLQSASNGELDQEIKIDSKDEFAIIASNVNTMYSRMQDLIEKRRVAEEKRQEDKFKLLEARYNALLVQINPHFLYNVLESINGIAKLNGDNEVSNLILRLAKLFRSNVDRRQSLCSLSQELDFIDNYLTIYQQMYPEKLSYSINVSPTIFDIEIPTFILQPVVENAILHGVELNNTGGHITVSAKKEGEFLVLSVKDNGKGIPSDKQECLRGSLKNISTKIYTSKHFGLINIQGRIRLIYGNNCGIKFSSQEGIGTEVKLYLSI